MSSSPRIFPTLALLSQGPTVSGLAEVEARTPEEIMDLLHQGNQSRTQQATRANAVSSRSHAVLQVGPICKGFFKNKTRQNETRRPVASVVATVTFGLFADGQELSVQPLT